MNRVLSGLPQIKQTIALLCLLSCTCLFWTLADVGARADDSGATCTILNAAADGMNQVMAGKSYYPSAAFISATVNCDKKAMNLTQKIEMSDKNQPSFSWSVAQVALNDIICKNPTNRRFIDQGWSWNSTLVFTNGVQRTFTAMCAGIPSPDAPAAGSGPSNESAPRSSLSAPVASSPTPAGASQQAAAQTEPVQALVQAEASATKPPDAAQPATNASSGTLSATTHDSTSTGPVISSVDIQTGDRWVYSIVDDITGNLEATQSLVVTEKVGHTVTVASTLVKAGRPGPGGLLVFDDTWGMINNGAQFRPADPGTGIKLPLKTGSVWKTKYRMIAPNHLGFDGTSTSKVLDWEHLTLRSGLEYDAYKVETMQSVGPVGGAPTMLSKIDLWYAPAANRFVKRIEEDRKGGRLAQRRIQELVAYTRRADN